MDQELSKNMKNLHKFVAGKCTATLPIFYGRVLSQYVLCPPRESHEGDTQAFTDLARKNCLDDPGRMERVDNKGKLKAAYLRARCRHGITAMSNGSRIIDLSGQGKKLARLGSDTSVYNSRRISTTLASQSIDQVVVEAVLGLTTSESNMSLRYRQRISDQRMQAVVDHERHWRKGSTE